MLVHGCVGKPIFPGLGFQRDTNIDTVDVITSKSSTLPYDDDTMRRMIRLVQAAKGKRVFCKEGRENLLYSSDAKGGYAYYTAGISGYTARARRSLTDSFSSAPSVVFW